MVLSPIKPDVKKQRDLVLVTNKVVTRTGSTNPQDYPSKQFSFIFSSPLAPCIFI